MTAYLTGLSLGFTLIMAIGAQNAFVLRQGLKREYVFTICLICALSDALLITLGVSGFYLLVKTTPWLETAARYGGAAFLVLYGLKSLWSAWKSNQSLQPALDNKASLPVIVMTSLGFTWLNPHVYLDTVVLLGSISTQFPNQKLFFASGAISASFLFFFALGYGSSLLIPLFQKPVAWKILDVIIAVIMFSIAVGLVSGST